MVVFAEVFRSKGKRMTWNIRWPLNSHLKLDIDLTDEQEHIVSIYDLKRSLKLFSGGSLTNPRYNLTPE